MKAALIVAIVLGALAAIVFAIDQPGFHRVGLTLLACSIVALDVAHWPGLKP